MTSGPCNLCISLNVSLLCSMEQGGIQGGGESCPFSLREGFLLPFPGMLDLSCCSFSWSTHCHFSSYPLTSYSGYLGAESLLPCALAHRIFLPKHCGLDKITAILTVHPSIIFSNNITALLHLQFKILDSL